MAGRARGRPLTRQRIAEAAIGLFAEKGVDRTTMKDIAQALGVSEPALYRYHASKEALYTSAFLEAYERIAREAVETCLREPDFRRCVAALVALFARLFDKEGDVFTFVLIDHHRYLGAVPADAERNPVEALRRLFARSMDAGDIPRRGSPDFAVAVSLGIVVHTAIFVHYGRLRRPLSSRVGEMTRAVLAALGATDADDSK
jgi:AcrR family transcriptional regulator